MNWHEVTLVYSFHLVPEEERISAINIFRDILEGKEKAIFIIIESFDLVSPYIRFKKYVLYLDCTLSLKYFLQTNFDIWQYSRVWWLISIILVLGRRRQEEHEFMFRQGCRKRRPFVKKATRTYDTCVVGSCQL